MLTALYHLQALKWAIPACFMLGSSPNFVAIWGAWRLLSAPFPTHVYERGDEWLYNFYQKLVIFFYENYTGVEVILYGDVDKLVQKPENVILMCNHQSTVDWVVTDLLAERQGSLGHIRYILKDGLKYFPIYGFYFRQHSCIYVKRSGKFKEKKAAEQLQMLIKNKTPYWMVVFPEGTRYNPDLPDVIAKSKTHAEKNGLAALQHVLTPRPKALQLCIEELRPTADAVYDVTIAYSNTSDPESKQRLKSPGLPDFLHGQCKQLHILVNRIPIDEVPTGDENIQKWLHQCFQEKDKLLEKFYSADAEVAGTLGPDGQRSEVGLRYTLPVFLLWSAINLPLWGTATGRTIYWKTSLTLMTTGMLWMTIRS